MFSFKEKKLVIFSTAVIVLLLVSIVFFLYDPYEEEDAHNGRFLGEWRLGCNNSIPTEVLCTYYENGSRK